jgi:hypothetical protein
MCIEKLELLLLDSLEDLDLEASSDCVVIVVGGAVNISLLRILACEDDEVHPEDILRLLVSKDADGPHQQEEILEFLVHEERHLFPEILMIPPDYVEMPAFETIPQHHLWNQHARRPGKSSKRSGGSLRAKVQAHKKY